MRGGDEQCVDRAAGDHILATAENLDALFEVLLELVRRGAADGGEFTAATLPSSRSLAWKRPMLPMPMMPMRTLSMNGQGSVPSATRLAKRGVLSGLT